MQEFGHADVPYQWPRNPALASWVEAQRRRALGTQGAPLTPSQHSRLLSCGCDSQGMPLPVLLLSMPACLLAAVQTRSLTPSHPHLPLAATPLCRFRFEVLREEWERRHAELLELQRQRSGQLTSAPLPAAGGLRGWAAGQRRQWQAGRLAPDRCAPAADQGRQWEQTLACAAFFAPTATPRLMPHPFAHPGRRAAKLQALGLLHGTGRPWKQCLAALDGLISCLGFPAAYALLVLAPQATGAVAMAAAAVEASTASGGSGAAGGSSSEDVGGSDSGSGSASAVTPADAAGAVRWYRGLHKRRRPLPADMAAALAARGLSLDQG